MTRQNDTERLAMFLGYQFGKMTKNGLVIYYEPRGYFDPFVSLSDAFLVAEKIREKDEYAHFELKAHGGRRALRSTHGDWFCNMNSNMFPAWSGRLVKSPSEAIALAALAYLDARENKK